ncbi:cytochrome P450 [Streptomyces sp. CB02923]|uniref:cytochrome P450 n=1 Tax=Streptomyces sp. CB02923 TaxID=1718985 RepID=UPI00093AF829|nr:cytochrome P450 [Streptomyces sp. CB02923]OKH99354.1 cytochrome P450 [Streptomyces sp. CB02923]
MQTVPLRPVPGPRGLPWLGNLPAFGKDPLVFMARLRDEYGDAVTWSLGPRRSLFLSHPQHIAEFLASREHAYDLLDVGWAFQQITGESVIRSTGADWRRKRGLVQPAVRPRQVRRYARTMVGSALATADRWREGEQVDVRREMTLLTQCVVLRTLFGNDLGDRAQALGEAMAVAEHVVGAELRGIGLFLPGWVRTPSRRRLLDAVATIDAEVHRLIGARRDGAGAEGADGRRWTEGRTEGRIEPRTDGAGEDGEGGRDDDLLTRLLEAADEEQRPLSAKEVRDEAVTLWAAGHETTSTALTWIWCLLSRSPEVRARLDDELDRVLGGRPPTVDDHEQLHWTRQIVKEALRIYPPAWVIAAVAREGAVLGGTVVPAGTAVWCSQWTAHRDPRWFPDPTAFRPERWDADAPDAIPDHAWFPFGGGSRACIGARFAQVEAVLLLATLAQRFHLEVTPEEAPHQIGILIQPAVPLVGTVRVRPRS